MIEQEFREIYELAREAGVRVLLEEASFWKKDVSDTIGQMASHYERAFAIFLNYRTIFKV